MSRSMHKHRYKRERFDLCSLLWIWTCKCGRWFVKE